MGGESHPHGVRHKEAGGVEKYDDCSLETAGGCISKEAMEEAALWPEH